MAQALFDEHPLGEYLREAGDTLFSMPGMSSDLEREMDPHYGQLDETEGSDEPLPEWRPQLLLEILELLQSFLASAQTSNSSNPFVERFKYNVISSSLLAPSLPAPQPRRSSPIPGKLSHSRESSIEPDHPIPRTANAPEPTFGPASAAALATAMFFTIGYPTLSLLSLFATLFFIYDSIYTTETPKHDMTSSFNALDDLVAANTLWESVVQDTVTFLEDEERSLHNSSGSSTPSPIRVALHSCLQSSHTQCDNIRHLFSALTSPAELSQLAEMYAPPSPIKTAFSTEMSARPYSYPSSTLKSPAKPVSTPTTPENKRMTWNGSYAGLAEAGSPTSSINRRRERHRANLSDVFEITSSTSAPVTPLSIHTGGLPDVVEVEEPRTSTSSYFPTSQFGAAALDLRRKQKIQAIEVLKSPPPSHFTSDLRSPRSARNSMFFSTISSSSKFTSPQPARHPLSFTALTYSLQGAVASKRYACSHLLALRFSDEEDEGYWEDVRSVMALLTSTFVDTSSRLSQALEEVEHQKLQDQNPTPNQSRFNEIEIEVPEMETANGEPRKGDNLRKLRRYGSRSKITFAPMPSHISRFAVHVAAISSALDDARDHLEQCVSDLKDDPQPPAPLTLHQRRLKHARSFSRPLFSAAPSGTSEPESEAEEQHRALQAYERFRRELGVALRECERGRERLLEIVNPPAIPSDDEDDTDDLPALGHDASDDSADPTSPRSESDDGEPTPGGPVVMNTTGLDGDDATSHLLLATTTQHLPLPGIEEVFEAETESKAAFFRERSKLTRDERIQLSKARRESGKGLAGLGPGNVEESVGGGNKENWGPGGEVVQELKDVIWRVGERRRRLTEEMAAAPAVSEEVEQHVPVLPVEDAQVHEVVAQSPEMMSPPGLQILESY